MKFTDKPYYKQPWYNTYRSMMDRCYRKGAANYSRYGGRGITVCDEWQDIETFAIWCEHSGYKKGLTIAGRRITFISTETQLCIGLSALRRKQV